MIDEIWEEEEKKERLLQILIGLPWCEELEVAADIAEEEEGRKDGD